MRTNRLSETVPCIRHMANVDTRRSDYGQTFVLSGYRHRRRRTVSLLKRRSLLFDEASGDDEGKRSGKLSRCRQSVEAYAGRELSSIHGQ